MAIELSKDTLEPEWPLLMFNDKYVRKPWSRKRFHIVSEEDLKKGKFKDNLIIIDVNCLKFPVLDVVDLGRKLWSLDFFAPARLHRIKYIYGPPQQLSFDDARKEVCGLIVRKRWHVHERRDQFLERCDGYRTMKDLIDSISFYGSWSAAG